MPVTASQPETAPEIVALSPQMREVVAVSERVAPTLSSVLLVGESGVGKELVARYIHSRGGRQRGPFVPVDCAALAAELADSQLFGHEPGAFTGATSAHRGLFRAASGGTLLLDEVGALRSDVQPKLLRVLEQRTVRPVGALAEIPVDVRLLSSATASSVEALASGGLRLDLFHRLAVAVIEIPPLRERPDDILPLAYHFLRRFSPAPGAGPRTFSPEAEAILQAHAWLGNVRELRHAVEAICVLGARKAVTPDAIPERIRRAVAEPAALPIGNSGPTSLREAERRAILAALAATDGNKSRAAEILGISRTTLHAKLREFSHG